MMRTAVFKLCGHRSAGPRAVLDQSLSRIRAPISPPPSRKVGADSCRMAVPSGAGSRFSPEAKDIVNLRELDGGKADGILKGTPRRPLPLGRGERTPMT